MKKTKIQAHRFTRAYKHGHASFCLLVAAPRLFSRAESKCFSTSLVYLERAASTSAEDTQTRMPSEGLFTWKRGYTRLSLSSVSCCDAASVPPNTVTSGLEAPVQQSAGCCRRRLLAKGRQLDPGKFREKITLKGTSCLQIKCGGDLWWFSRGITH